MKDKLHELGCHAVAPAFSATARLDCGLYVPYSSGPGMDQAPQGLQLDPDMVAQTVMTWPAASRRELSGGRAEIDGIAVLVAASLPGTWQV